MKTVDYGCSHPGSGFPTGNIGADCSTGTDGGVQYSAVRGAFCRLFEGRNLMDELSCRAKIDAVYGTPGLPRTFMVKLRHKFSGRRHSPLWRNASDNVSRTGFRCGSSSL